MRYIDPYQLGMAVQESMYKNPHGDPKVARNHRFEHEHFLRLIALAPDADVEPVVRAHWCWEGRFKACSKCGSYVEFTETLGASHWKYCPYCGAKMEVKVEHGIIKEEEE